MPRLNTNLVLQEQPLGSVDDIFHQEGAFFEQGGPTGLYDKAEYHEGLYHQLSVLWVGQAVQLALQGERKFQLPRCHLQ